MKSIALRGLSLVIMIVYTLKVNPAQGELNAQITCILKDVETIDATFPLVACNEFRVGYQRVSIGRCEGPLSIEVPVKTDNFPSKRILVYVSAWRWRKTSKLKVCSSWVAEEELNASGNSWNRTTTGTFFLHSPFPSDCFSIGSRATWAIASMPSEGEDPLACYFELTQSTP
jgi:hypothetical protein